MIELHEVTKRYGTLTALSDVTLTVPAGEVFGLIGPNGAGKTTTLSILATLLQPTRGTVAVGGLELPRHAREVRRIIGYMPDFAGLYEDMQVDEYLYFFAAAAGITGKKADGVVRDVLELTELTHRRVSLVETLSRGMRQRLGIARVLVHDPKVLLLDEPAAGLDPRARVEMRHLLRELRAMDKTVVISSHILHELAEICTSVGILEQGNLRYTGSVADLMRRMRRAHIALVRVLRNDCGPDESRRRARETLVEDERVQGTYELEEMIEVHARPGQVDLSFIPELLIAKDYRVHYFSEEPLTLEDAFMRLTEQEEIEAASEAPA